MTSIRPRSCSGTRTKPIRPLPARALSMAAAVLVAALAAACSVKTVAPPPSTDRPEGGVGGVADGPAGGDGGGSYTRPTVGACATPPSSHKALGEPCGCHDECATGQCVDGVCCSAACTGTCMACNIPGMMGTCSPIPSGLAPVVAGQCTAQAVSSCGLDGTCDGRGACRSYPDGTVCAPGTCAADNTITGTQVCTGGACKTGGTVVCAPFGCDPTSGKCYDHCTTNDQCVGAACTAGSCGQKANGMTCTQGSDCQSTFCGDGVCCDQDCKGACLSCAVVGHIGQCTPVAAGNPDPHGVCRREDASTCGETGSCNGVGGCAHYAAGAICKPAACADGSLTPASACDVNGMCVGGMSGSCAPYVCGDAQSCKVQCANDADCVPGRSCQNGSCGPKALGQVCQAAADCASGFCVDGLCCESACEGKCVSCAMANSPGRCRNVPADALDPRAAAGVTDPARICVDQGAASCGTNGRCDGNAGCALYASGTICQAESCDPVANRSSVGTCDGGTCQVVTTDCDPYACNGSQCASTCSTNVQCAVSHVCLNQSCGKKPIGAACTAAGAAECASGICAQGVCCGTPCGGSCMSCALPKSPGVCVPVPNGSPDPAKTCVDQKASSCGTDGLCNGNGQCRLYAVGTLCSAAKCAAGVTTKAAFCDANHSCPPSATETCTPIIVCNAGKTDCERTCVRDDQCMAGVKCFGGKCGLLDNGKACGDGTDCVSKNCVDGVCCDGPCGTMNGKASTNDCQACSVAAGAAVDGTCGARDKLPCSDGKKCTVGDVCSGTECVSGPEVTCPAPDMCHAVGACDPTSGACSNPNVANDLPCDDGDKCTVDTCQNGRCTPGPRKTCDGMPGAPCGNVCDSKTGGCVAPEGAKCTDACLVKAAGMCSGNTCTGKPLCTSTDPCKIATCTGGSCGTMNVTDGTDCKTSNLCLTGQKCMNGTCMGGTPAVTCDACNTCNPATGKCKADTGLNGTACNDNKTCGVGGTCKAGKCAGVTSKCDATCQTCNAGTGNCDVKPMSDGLICGAACGKCSSGTCTPSLPVCDDGNACTTDTCKNMKCQHAAVANCPPPGM